MAADGKFLSTAIDVSIGQSCILLKAKPLLMSGTSSLTSVAVFRVLGGIWRNKVFYFSKIGYFGCDLEK